MDGGKGVLTMNRIHLCGHTGSINRGCEAIVRATVKILNKKRGSQSIVLASFNEQDDKYFGIHDICSILPYSFYSKYSVQRIIGGVARKVFGNYMLGQKFIQRDLINSMKEGNLFITIGGDTYCYSKPYVAYALNQFAKKKNVKTVFWCCSVEESVIDNEMIDDLNRYSLIITRESLTYKNILNVVRDEKKVKLCADPAFVLDTAKIDLPPQFDSGNTVGLNLSPIVMESGESDLALLNYDKLVRYILDNSNMKIALIPHVFSPTNPQDLIPHRLLYEKYRHTNRMLIFESMYNCMQLKYIISQCRMFVGARTHATIAAYSTCVPTLVVGYSIKSKGIARDIFGTEDNMVIPVQSLEHDNDLVNTFKYIQENEDAIRKHLQDFMPSYIEKAWQAGEEVGKLIVK